MEPLRFMLDQSEIPTHWYNVVADMPHPPAPTLGPDNKPVPLEKMAAIFPMALLEQETSSDGFRYRSPCAKFTVCGDRRR